MLLGTLGEVVSPLFLAVQFRRPQVFLPLLTSHFSNFSSAGLLSLLDQEIKYQRAPDPHIKQTVRQWAVDWEIKGSFLYGPVFYAGSQLQLEKAAQGRKKKNKAHIYAFKTKIAALFDPSG